MLESKAIDSMVRRRLLPFLENEAFRMPRASLRYFDVDEDVRPMLEMSWLREGCISAICSLFSQLRP